MTLIRHYRPGEPLPWWQGVIRYDDNVQDYLCAPLGLNLLFRWWIAWVSPLRQAPSPHPLERKYEALRQECFRLREENAALRTERDAMKQLVGQLRP